MTKRDIANQVSERVGLSNSDAYELTDFVFETLKSNIVKSKKVLISGFGSFEVKSKKARKGRNPQTSEDMTIPAHNVLRFKPSQLLRKRFASSEG